MRTLSQGLATQSLGGASKEAIKLAIKTLVKQLKPLLMDTAAVSYCGRTAAVLQYSANQMSSWASATSGILANSQAAVIRAEATNDAATFLGLVGNFYKRARYLEGFSDSDGDGVNDDVDGAPEDASSSALRTPPGMPVVVVAPSLVVLTAADPYALVEVTNGGSGELFWRAATSNDGLVIATPIPGEERPSGRLLISLPAGFEFLGDSALRAGVVVKDLLGNSKQNTPFLIDPLHHSRAGGNSSRFQSFTSLSNRV